MVVASTTNKKVERFVRIAEKRTQRVLESLRLLGQCSNIRSYEYTNEEATKIFREIRRCLRETEQSFRGAKSRTSFRL